MIASHSPLHWQEFGVLEWKQKFIKPSQEITEIRPSSFFEEYIIDVDFSHAEPDGDTIQVFVEIGINNGGSPKPGYRIFVGAVGIFDISNTKDLPDKQKQNLEIFATANLMIGRIRGLISMLSSQGPFGPYNLPSLDLGALFEEKAASVENKTDE